MAAFTKLATGEITGRHAFGLPCGCGKTVAVRAWCGQLIRAGLPYSVMITAGRIEELDAVYRQLRAEGIPADAIGILHGETSGHRFVPPTADNRSHARMKNGGGGVREDLLYRADRAGAVGRGVHRLLLGFEKLAGAIGWCTAAGAGRHDLDAARTAQRGSGGPATEAPEATTHSRAIWNIRRIGEDAPLVRRAGSSL